ncbi:MAG TPA: YbhB/YbcL family Raf kinase inhibitor-like protein [Isosphaeraceae bacterium]|jgi:hypothetical protein|nr:YbhB/YbcL family Raf kinase inhibitor-like protein [Isosphaeraceae bacterium]
MKARTLWLLSAVAVIPACGSRDTEAPAAPLTIKLTSRAFSEGTAIPKKHTCDGDDTSPPLSWTNVPQKAQSLALICEDPDAPTGTFTHWLVYNLSADLTELNEGIHRTETFTPASGDKHDVPAHQGKNDFGNLGYGGPCPPSGTHHYYFKLFALDTTPDLKPGATRSQLLSAIKDHVLAEGRLMGTYAR